MPADDRERAAADLLIRSSAILPMTAVGRALDGAILLSGGRISAIGRVEAVARMAPGVRVLDVGDRPVLPGFVDAHAHLEMTARAIATAIPVYTPPCTSIDDVLAQFSANLHRADEFGGWVVGQGSLFQDRKLTDGRLPTRDDLDSVSTSTPLAFRPGGHTLVVNTPALEIVAAQVDLDSLDRSRVEVDSAGKYTGVFRELEIAVTALIPEPVGFDLATSILSTARDHFLANGVTSVQDIPSTVAGLYVLDELASAGLLPVKVSEYVTAPKLISSADAGSVRERFPLRSPEDRMRIAGIKIFIDGGVSASLAAVLEPYVGTQSNRGQLFFTEDEVSALVRDCAAADLQLIAHTMGERAQRLLCAAAERVPQRGVVRAEHGGVFMTEPATLDRFVESGVLPVPNAVFLYTMCDFIPESVGPQALRGRLPLRTMADRGVVLAGSSDSAGSELRHANPFFGIWCAVARMSFRGDVLEPEQAISVDEALYMHTAGAAAAGGQAATKGALEVGKAADVVVLNTDPRALPADDLLAVHPDYVFVDGQQRYAAT